MLGDLGIHVLDVLGEVSGGRGDYKNNIPRYFLGIILWSLMLTWAWTFRKRNRKLHPRQSLLIIGLGLGLLREACLFLTTSLVVMGSVSVSALALFVPPLELALMLLSQCAIAAAFVFNFDLGAPKAKRFIATVALIFLPFILICLWSWSSHVLSGGSQLFSLHWTGIVLYSFGLVITGNAVARLARSGKQLQWVICVPFMLFFLDHLLALINGLVGEHYIEYIAPVRNTLFLAALPWFGYLFWREQLEERQRLTEIFKQSSRLNKVGHLAAGVAHDFNNHLQAIMGYAELGQQQSKSASKELESFDNIIHSVERASALVGHLMAFQRENEADSEHAVDVSKLMNDLAPMTRSLLGSAIVVDQVLDERPALVRADRVTIEQMIINLVANARDAMPDGGTLTVRSHIVEGSDLLHPSAKREPHMRFSITDTGVGMQSDVLRHASDPFFTTKTDTGGTGLGLASVFNLVNQLDGFIDIDSKPHRGTTVRVDLPIATTRVEARVIEKSANSNARGRGELILMAERNTSNRNITAAHLRSLGYEVITAINGTDAVTKAFDCEKRIDLLLLDVEMPGLNGYQVREHIVAKLGEVPTVLMTARMPGPTDIDDDFVHLSMPFHRQELAFIVAEALSNKIIDPAASPR